MAPVSTGEIVSLSHKLQPTPSPERLPQRPAALEGEALPGDAAPPSRAAGEILRLQRAYGNRNVQRVVARRRVLRRQPAGVVDAQHGGKLRYEIKIPPGVTTLLELLRYAEVQIFGRVVDIPWNAATAPDAVNAPAKNVGKSIKFWVDPALVETYGGPPASPEAKAAADKEYKDLGAGEKDGINAEIDKRYYQSTQDAPGTRIKPGEKGKAVVWNSLRDQVLADRKKLAALPDTVKELLGESNFTPENYRILAQIGEALSQLSDDELKAFFTGGPNGATVSPADYARLLSLAQKLAALAPGARKDYLGRVNATTTSLADLEGALDRYLQFRAGREKQFQGHEEAAKPLLGAEDLYAAYRDYKDLERNVGLARALKGSARDKAEAEDSYQELQTRFKEAESTLLSLLKQKGFDSIATFEAAIESYRVAFRTQAVNLALDVLDRYAHMLFAEQKKLQQGGAAAIAQGIAASKGPELYKEHRKQRQTAQGILFANAASESTDFSWLDPYNEAMDAAKAAKQKGEAEVIRGAGNDPLVGERGVDLEKLAGLDTAGVQSYLSALIRERSESIATARQEFQEDPDRVFRLPDLVGATQKLLGIDPATIYGRSIHDYVADEASKHLLSQIALGVLALALTFLVPGGGWLAAAALVAQAGISTYQAYAAYQEYQEKERDYELGFLAEEPSLFWVGLAVAAAALDVGVAASALVKQSATALKALKGPLLEFSKDSDLAKLLGKIEAAESLDAKFKAALAREAKASLAAKEAFKELVALGSRTNAFAGFVDPGVVKQLFRALYYSVQRGINSIARLSADAKFLEIAGDLTHLTGAERSQLETAFEEVKQLVQAGQARGVDEKSLLGFVDRWALNRTKPGFQVKLSEEIKAWKPLSADQTRALNALETQKSAVATLYEQKAAAEEELAALRAKPDRNAEDVAEIRALEQEIRSLDPNALPGRSGLGRGKIAEAEATLATRESEAARANLTLYDRLRAAAPSEAAKERALRGVVVDQVGPLKVKPGPLQADHIVSVREISDLDGFADLPWKDQKAVVDLKENLIAMDGAANASKSDRTWRSWSQASRFYEQATIETMAKREADVRVLIQAEIKDRLAKLAGGKP